MILEHRFQINGILLIDKPEWLTSAAVVARIKKRFNLEKVGHAGTLDPLATGLLPICINEGTKLAGYLSSHCKRYRTTLKLGEATDSYDRTGNVTQTKPVTCSEKELEEAVESFMGQSEQIPPMFCARKVEGRPLYELARKGMEIERNPSLVTIFQIEIHEISFPFVTLTVSASKGFYVRSLCHDIGQKLGCGAHMTHLTRIAHGPFHLRDAIALEKLLSDGESELVSRTIPMESPQIDIPILHISDEMLDHVLHGRPIPLKIAREAHEPLSEGAPSYWRAISSKGRMVALLHLLVPPEEWEKTPVAESVWKVERGIVS